MSKNKLVMALLVFSTSGAACSFHSNQLEVLKTVFQRDKGPEPEWVFSWGEISEKVFAINAGSTILFANSEGVLVRFNGSFVESIDGLKIGSGKAITISITRTKYNTSEMFNYRGSGVDYGDLYCGVPSERAAELALKTGIIKVIEIRQNCGIDDASVEQNIFLNQSRQLVGLQFILHPDHEPAMIRYNPA